MRKVIIVEGPDESGKTELVNKLAAHYIGSRIVKSPAGRSTTWQDEWSYWAEELARSNAKVPLILDRTPEISELVYGSVVRGSSRVLRPRNVFETWQFLTNISVVFCLPGIYDPKSEHISPFGNSVNQYLEKIYGAYEVLYHLLYQGRNLVFSYDWHIDPVASSLTNVLDQLMEE